MKAKIIFLLLFFSFQSLGQSSYNLVDQYIDKKNVKSMKTNDLFILLDSVDIKFTAKKDKVRAVHKIVIELLSYDYDKLEVIRNHPVTYSQIYGASIKERIQYALKVRKGVCADYSRLLAYFGNYLSLEISYVSGFGKIYKKNSAEKTELGRHAWNHVSIDGKNYFIDATWSDTKWGNGIDKYFLVPPEKMIYSHMPRNPLHQKLDKVISMDKFMEMPYVSSSYNTKEEIVDFYPKQNIKMDKEKNNYKFGLTLSEKITNTDMVYIKTNRNTKITTSNKIIQNNILILNFQIEEEAIPNELFVYLKNENQQGRLLFKYKIIK